MFLAGWNGSKSYPRTPRSPSSSPRRSGKSTGSLNHDANRRCVTDIRPPSNMNYDCLENELRFLRHQVSLKDRTIEELQRTITLLSSSIRESRSRSKLRPKASFGETSDCSDQTFAQEAFEGNTKLESRRYEAKSAVHTARGPHSSRMNTARQRPSSVVRSKPHDEIDEIVQSYLSDRDQVGRLKWISYGVYLIGTKKIAVTVKNDKPLVRIGGGAFVHLDVYLVNH